MDCIAKNTDLLVEFKSAEDEAKNFNCFCEPNCIYSNIFIDFYNVLEGTTDLLGTIGAIIIVKQYPLKRYKRKILFSIVDLFGMLF